MDIRVVFLLISGIEIPICKLFTNDICFYLPFKAHTHTPIFGGSAVKSAIESVDSITESADSTTDSVIVSQLSVLYMFNILKPLESADYYSYYNFYSRPSENRPSGYRP